MIGLTQLQSFYLSSSFVIVFFFLSFVLFLFLIFFLIFHVIFVLFVLFALLFLHRTPAIY